MQKIGWKPVISIVVLTCRFSSVAGDDKYERGRFENILNVVAKDVQKNFYDPAMKGLDWNALTETARKRIRQADHIGEMNAAIFALTYQLNDSHTVFVPPGRTSRAVYGFEAKPFGDKIMVYELKKGGPAEKAGLQLGDSIVRVNNFKVERGNSPV